MSYYLIKSKLTGFVLDVEGGGGKPGARVIPWDKHGKDNQMWYDCPATGTIRSKAGNLCLAVEHDQLCVQPYKAGDPNQQWMRQDQHIRNRPNPSRVLDIANVSRDKGAKITAWNFNGQQNQSWDYEYVGPRREFVVVSEMHQKVLDVEGNNANAGARLIVWPRKDKPPKNTLWYLDTHGYIRSCLNDMAFSNSGSGQGLRMHPAGDDPRSQWYIDGNKIMSRAGECLDIGKQNRDDGAELISYQYKSSANQHWRIDYI